MWQKKANKSDGASDEQATGAVDDAPFDVERILSELHEREEDIGPADVALFPEPLRSTLNFAIQIGKISLEDFASRLGLDIPQARRLAALLAAKKFFRISSFSAGQAIFYEVGHASITRPLPSIKLRLGKKDS